MKVLLLFTYNYSLELWNKTGLLFREIQLYKKLVERNIDVFFLTYGDNTDLNYSKNLKNIRIIPTYNYTASKNRRINFIKSLLLPFKLKGIFKSVDFIKTNQLEGSWVGWLGKLFYKKKFIVRGGFEWLKFYILENEARNYKKNFKYWLRFLWRYFIEFVSYKLADHIILTNPMDIDFIVKTFKLGRKKEKIHHFYNYIDVNLFRHSNMRKEDKHVLFIGRLSYQKNITNLLKAFENLEGFFLDIIGDPPNDENIIKKVKNLGNRVNFLGRFPNNKLPEIINQYQIFILPSFYEGNPKVLLEAMSCGIACIGSNVWGIKNIIKHKENGFLCETDSESIKNAILALNNDDIMRKRIGINARKFVIKNCSLETTVKKEYSLYKSLLP